MAAHPSLSASAVTRVASADPLVEAIDIYRAGVARYNAEIADDATNEQCDALVEETYGPVYRMDPLPAATTERGVVAALHAVLAEDAFLDQFCERLILAALAYFEGRVS